MRVIAHRTSAFLSQLVYRSAQPKTSRVARGRGRAVFRAAAFRIDARSLEAGG
jgi:hypothetical protein